ncbi:MAG: type II toxin-antitoxin system HicA family toxin [Gammaproteobacteria bacterium]
MPSILSPPTLPLRLRHNSRPYGYAGGVAHRSSASATELPVLLLGKAGWNALGQVGSHLVMVKPGVRVNLSIPQHKELSVGTLRSWIRHAELSVEEFLDLL